MVLPADITSQQTLYKWSFRLAAIVGMVAALVLLGWYANIDILKRMVSPVTVMYPLTATFFLLIIAAFYLLKNKKRSWGFSIAVFTLCAAIIRFFITVLHYNDAFHALLNSRTLIIYTGMAPTVSLGFVFALSSLILLYLPYKTSKLAAQIVAIFLFILGLLALLGYLYEAEKMYGIILSLPMALHTGLCFVLLSLAILFQKPGVAVMALITSRLTGSVLSRLLIPAAIIIPSVLGLIALSGYHSQQYNVDHGFVYFALSIIVVFVGLVTYNAFLLNRRDLERRRTEEALQDSEQQIRTIFENAPEGIVVIDGNGNIAQWNEEACRLFGWTSEEAVGSILADLIIPAESRAAYNRFFQRYLFFKKDDVLARTLDLKALKKDTTLLDVSLRISSLLIKQKTYFVGFFRDITQRKRMEQQLHAFNESLSKQVQEKTSELTDMFERLTDGFIALDENYCYTYINKRAAEMIHKDPASLIGKCVWDIFPDVVGSPTYQAFQQAMTTQQYVRNTDFYAPLDLWQENNVYPSQKGLSVFIRDISMQMRKEKEVSETRELADKLIYSLPGVFYFYDINGKFIRWNKQLEEVTGYSAEEIAVMHPVELFADEDKEYISSRIATVFEKGINDAEATFISKTGVRTSYYFRATLIQYNGGPCLLGTGFDITERKRAEKDLKESEQQYKLLFEKNPVAMWMLSLPDYKVIDVNSASLQQYGYTYDEFFTIQMTSLVDPIEYPRMYAQINKNFRGLYYPGVWRHQKKDGTTIYADVVTHDIYYHGAPVRLVLAKEITEQYKAEEKLRQSYDEVKRLTEYLQKIREEERIHISHEIHDELGQLLTVLKMDISWIDKRLNENGSPIKARIKEAIQTIDVTITSIRRIASELRPALLDDLGLIAAMKWHIKEFEKRSNIAAIIDLPDEELPLPDAYKTGMYRILQESLTNVSRHSGATTVTIVMRRSNGDAVLTITDNGKGFDATKRSQKTLGLLGMKERSEAMGGQYNISSIIGEGTNVTITVPIIIEQEI
ncbi:MAG: PAS domain S-box protein [Agriterribacter sp.]